jgi:hypothetical protein
MIAACLICFGGYSWQWYKSYRLYKDREELEDALRSSLQWLNRYADQLNNIDRRKRVTTWDVWTWLYRCRYERDGISQFPDAQ